MDSLFGLFLCHYLSSISERMSNQLSANKYSLVIFKPMIDSQLYTAHYHTPMGTCCNLMIISDQYNFHLVEKML